MVMQGQRVFRHGRIYNTGQAVHHFQVSEGIKEIVHDPVVKDNDLCDQDFHSVCYVVHDEPQETA